MACSALINRRLNSSPSIPALCPPWLLLQLVPVQSCREWHLHHPLILNIQLVIFSAFKLKIQQFLGYSMHSSDRMGGSQVQAVHQATIGYPPDPHPSAIISAGPQVRKFHFYIQFCSFQGCQAKRGRTTKQCQWRNRHFCRPSNAQHQT